MISMYTENQLKLGGVWDMWETKKKIPTLHNKKELDEVYIPQYMFECIEGMEFLNYKGKKVTKETPWECKRSKVMGKECITIQEVDRDEVCGAKIITNDIELIIWLEDFKHLPRNKQRVVNIDKKDVYDINNLEKHGVRFNSTIDKKEELDKNGYMISNLDHYDNYWYEIYDTMRNTYKHQKYLDFIEADEVVGQFIEDWIDSHDINNDIEEVVEWWCDEIEKALENYIYKYENVYDRNTFGKVVYKKMRGISKKLEIPLTICWDIWKILTKESMERALKEIDGRYEIFNLQKEDRPRLPIGSFGNIGEVVIRFANDGSVYIRE